MVIFPVARFSIFLNFICGRRSLGKLRHAVGRRVVADEDGEVVVLGAGPELQGGDDMIGGLIGTLTCCFLQKC